MMRTDQDQPAQSSTHQKKEEKVEMRCKRCGQLLESLERETYFARTGLCFWCAYVDSQG